MPQAMLNAAICTVEQLETRRLLAATPVGINFGANRVDANGNPFTLAPTDTAGVIPITHWNNENDSGTVGPPPAPLSDPNLNDANGNPSGVGVQWLSNGTWDSATQEDMTDQFTGGDHTLMAGYLDNYGVDANNPMGQYTPATSASLTSGMLDGNGILLTGLTASPTYDIYLYSLTAVHDRPDGVITLTASGAPDGRSITTPHTNSTSYVEGSNGVGNYLLFTGVKPMNGNVLITPDVTSFRTAFNGIEIVPPAPGAPAAPTNLAATPDANGVSIDLTWDQNGATNVVSYQVQRATAMGGPFTTIATVSPASGATGSYQDTLVHTNQPYFYRVLSFNTLNGGTTSAPSNTAGPVTLAATTASNDLGVNFGADRVVDPTATPTVPFALAPTDKAGVIPISNWNNAKNGSGETTILLDSTGAPTTVDVTWKANGTFDAATQEDMTDQFPNPSPDYTLMAGYLDNYGGTAGATAASLTSGTLDGNGVLFTGLPAQLYDVYVYSLPSVVGRGGYITATGKTSASARETAAISSNYVQGQDYVLLRDVQVGANGDLLIAPDGVSFRIAIQGVELVPATAPNSAPAAPTGVTARIGANGQSADITFNQTGTNTAAYQIQRATTAGGPFTTIATLGATGNSGTLTYNDATVRPNQNYFYQVVATNTFNGGSSATSAPPPAGPINIPVTTKPSDIGINFGADRTDNATTPATPFVLAPTDMAGFVPMANWNNETGGTGSTFFVKDQTGGYTTATLSWKANGTWDSATQEDQTDQFSGADRTLMAGYLDNYGGTKAATAASLTSGTLDGNGVLLTGLPAGAYDVYVYSLPSVIGRGGAITVTGASASTPQNISADISTSYVSGTNYLLFPKVTVATGGDLLITPDGTSFRDAIQGIELVPVQGAQLAADFNNDGKVDFSDLLILAQNYGKSPADHAHGDANGDQKVDFSDLLILAQTYGKTATGAPQKAGSLLSDVVGLVKTH